MNKGLTPWLYHQPVGFLPGMLAAASCAWLIVWTAGCRPGGAQDPVETARIAVRANPSLELVATDERQGVLTVRVKASGRLITVRATDVVAGTAFKDLDAGASAAAATTPTATASASTAPAATEPTTPATSGDGTLPEKPRRKATISVGGASVTSGRSGVSIETPGSRVKVTGTRATSASIETPAARVAVDSPSSGHVSSTQVETPPGSRQGAAIDDSRLERRTRPVSCIGVNTVTLTGVLLKVDGVAVSLTGNCSVEIRNSHVAGRIAIQAAGNGTVVVENSVIEGDVAFELTGLVATTVKSSTVRGSIQRLGGGEFHDAGGNLWR